MWSPTQHSTKSGEVGIRPIEKFMRRKDTDSIHLVGTRPIETFMRKVAAPPTVADNLHQGPDPSSITASPTLSTTAPPPHRRIYIRFHPTVRIDKPILAQIYHVWTTTVDPDPSTVLATLQNMTVASPHTTVQIAKVSLYCLVSWLPDSFLSLANGNCQF